MQTSVIDLISFVQAFGNHEDDVFLKVLNDALDKRDVEKKRIELTSLLYILNEVSKIKSDNRSKNLLEEIKLSLSKITVTKINTHHDLLNELKNITYVNGSRVVILQAEKAAKISELLESFLLSECITDTARLDFFDVQSKNYTVPKLSTEEVQLRRDEVREMAYLGKPKDGIPLYRGRRGGDVDAVSFFKENYSRYIEPSQEVIFAPELGAIDPGLLASLRNECRSAINPMPIGTVEDRTNARIEKRFFDGARTERSTKVAASRRTAKKDVCSSVGMIS